MRPLATVTVLFLLAAVAPGHPEDPKVLDREPRYEGPGWRADLRQPPPDFPSRNVALRAWISLPEFSPGASSGNDCWGYVSPAGREYAIIGLYDSTAFVEVTNPGDPQTLAVLNGPNSLWRDIKVYRHYAYAVSEGGGGIQVFDLSAIDSGVVTLLGNVTAGGAVVSHNVALDEVSGFLYRCGGVNEGLRIYDLSDPVNPTYVASWSDRYVHDAQVVTYTEGPYAGRQIAFACGGLNGGQGFTAVHIIDVTDKQNLTLLARVEYDEAGYCHQAWLSPDRQYLYVNDEMDETQQSSTTRSRVFDVSDLEHPAYLGDFTNGSTAIDHNLYTRGNLLFEANYRSGLRVFDATDPRRPVEIGYFDTYPTNNSANFNGLWSNFPYFPSGTIIGSDLERGLFVWRLEIPLTIGFPDGRPETLSQAGGALVRIQVNEQEAGGYAGATPLLHVDSGAGYQDIAMTPLGDNRFEAALPPAPCNTTVAYYVSVQAGSGQTITAPFNFADDGPYTLLAEGTEVTVASQSFEASDGGWSVDPDGTDDAVLGAWTWGDPVGDAAEPADDVSDPGVNCWYTGAFTDIDGGVTTLITPTFDLSALDFPVISYYRWLANHIGTSPQDDAMWVWISNDDGDTWSVVEKVGPQGPEATGGWRFHRFLVAGKIAPTATMRMKFVARDVRRDSRVEAAIDEFRVSDLSCVDCPFDVSGNGSVDLDDVLLVLANFGGPGSGDTNGNGVVDFDDLLNVLAHFGASCD